ncbi:hypothetical protein DSO57_1019342 [Entomophthora muscae]|uniref:Uncharacterized protein n=1 Tax=Entomophthora muscae TaxID=34485 RepID=A0ACC2SGS5_9FUNG|nr:hypothetical protein DSO57_1019342 [Entomophthora muscae]
MLDDEPTEKRGHKKKKANPEAIQEQATTKKAPDLLSYYKFLMVDFELAQASIFIKVFNRRPQGCFFPYCQALCKSLKKNPALDKLVFKDGTKEAKNIFKCFAALAMIRKKEADKEHLLGKLQI